MMNPVLWALVSSGAFGLSDFVGGAASRRAPALQIVLISYPVSAALIVLLACIVGGEPTLESLVWGAASGAVMAAAMWSFYWALAHGPMSVVSPLTAVIVTILPVSVGILQGERNSVVAMVGVAVAIVAVLLVSKEPRRTESDGRRMTLRILLVTAAAGFAFGFSFIFTGQIASGTGLWPLVAARSTATVVILAAAVASRQVRPPRGIALAGAVTVGALDVVANTAMLFAFQEGTLSLGSAVIALYPAVTVILAICILRERVAWWQTLGLVLAAASVFVISINS
ncbi:DMT family transporter [Microbacterium sp. Kw_RZR3]|jgi:drug/metabolite transporter (DMT)-like permease|uniref:DMT family transporter n=1 Tax=unclassified Microbacterium TaxID=2609290 RepID=UPI0023DC2171|nr:DMT family transporter [Microbacterium sp. Kw_RZR3]